MGTIFVLDYDGVIVDSYSNIRQIYEILKKKFNLPDGFVEVCLMLEDLIDFSEREDYWYSIYEKYLKEVFDMENFDEVLLEYWKLREDNQIIFEDAIEFLKKCGDKTIIVTGSDTNAGEKLKRIKKAGVDKYVREIYIHRWNSDSEDNFLNTLRNVLKNYNDKIIYYVDDKFTRLYLVNLLKKEFSNLNLIKRDYVPKGYPYSLSWKYPRMKVHTIKKLTELYKYCED